MENSVVANVGQDSRRNGRVSPERLLDDLYREREGLILEKQNIQAELFQIESWRKQQTSHILMRRLDRTRSIEATTKLESEVSAKKAPLVRELQTIEKRLHDIKTRLSGQYRQNDQTRSDVTVSVLLRIETLLEKILAAVDRPV